MKLYKPHFWSKKNSLIAYLLLPISVCIQFLRIMKNKIKKTQNYNVPIFCIGNIYLGGTGKTPMAIKIFELLEKFWRIYLDV